MRACFLPLHVIIEGLQPSTFNMSPLHFLHTAPVLDSARIIRACFTFVSDNRNLFHFPIDRFPLQCKNRIGAALKKADVLFPTHAAFAMLQSNELLLLFFPQLTQILLTTGFLQATTSSP